MGETGRPHEFNRAFGKKYEMKFFTEIDELAFHICQLLDILEQDRNGTEAIPATSQKDKIYLAQTSFDLKDERDKVSRELEQRGYEILPNQSLPETPEFVPAVRENLTDCKLSIHLVGEWYGVIPAGAEKSIVELQIEAAKEQKQQNSEFSYLIWLPPSLGAKEVRQEV